MQEANARFGLKLTDYASLYAWSIAERADFWRLLWDFCGVRGDPGGPVLLDDDRMPGARWFPEARLSFSENLLRRRDDADAIVFWGEDRVRRRLSHRQLYDQVARVARALHASGVRAGDRVAALLPNMPETVIAMLASASLGATWCSCSPDFGVRGVVDRFGQIAPEGAVRRRRLLLQRQDARLPGQAAAVVAALPTLERVVVVPVHAGRSRRHGPGDTGRCGTTSRRAPRDGEIEFARLPFDHPLFIMFSSGTTGAPKCIVHGAGGTLLQHLKEHVLHTDVKRDDRVFYFTTCGWMMWNWHVSALAAEATLLLYDGSPLHPGPRDPVRLRGHRAHDRVRHLRQVPRGRGQERARAAREPRPGERADAALDGLAALAAELRLRVRAHQAGSLPLVDLGRHRHRLLLRARLSALARVARRAAVPRPRHGRGGVGRRRPARARRRRASWSA